MVYKIWKTLYPSFSFKHLVLSLPTVQSPKMFCLKWYKAEKICKSTDLWSCNQRILSNFFHLKYLNDYYQNSCWWNFARLLLIFVAFYISANYVENNCSQATASSRWKTYFWRCCFPACYQPCWCHSVFQLRKWRGWQQCALIRWSPAHTRLPSAGGANSPPWDVCLNPGNGGRRRVTSSSRPLLVRTKILKHNTSISVQLPPALPPCGNLLHSHLRLWINVSLLHLATVALI